MDSPHKGQWRGTLMFSLICAWTNAWANNRNADNLGRHRAHYDVTVMHIFDYRILNILRVYLVSPNVYDSLQKNTPLNCSSKNIIYKCPLPEGASVFIIGFLWVMAQKAHLLNFRKRGSILGQISAAMGSVFPETPQPIAYFSRFWPFSPKWTILETQ